MFRSLEDVANATPKNYLDFVPADPTSLALMMMEKANRLFPIKSVDDASVTESGHSFLYVGPGSGLVCETLIQQEQMAHGLETSRRGIASAPDLIRNYVIWTKPWETSFPNKYFHVALISKFLKTLLTAEEYQETLKEIKRVSKYCAFYGEKENN